MGVRRHDAISLTVACALVAGHVRDPRDYRAKLEFVAEQVRRVAGEEGAGALAVEVNTGDDVAAGRVCLTVTGTSAEAGDDGEVGRGNRVNGLITPFRPMTLEAAAGKNPVTHVGKLYNVLAHRIAHALVERIDGVAEAHCCLVSQIGRPVHDPSLAGTELVLEAGASLHEVRLPAEEIVRDQLRTAPGLWEELIERVVPMY